MSRRTQGVVDQMSQYREETYGTHDQRVCVSIALIEMIDEYDRTKLDMSTFIEIHTDCVMKALTKASQPSPSITAKVMATISRVLGRKDHS